MKTEYDEIGLTKELKESNAIKNENNSNKELNKIKEINNGIE